MPRLSLLALVVALAPAAPVLAQAADSTRQSLTLSAYVDGYYAAFSEDLPAGELQPFTTAGARDNHVGLNVAQVGMDYAAPGVRSTVVLHYGDIAEATWSDDFPVVQQAFAGVRLRQNLWIDAGFFKTHVGSESFLPKDILLSQPGVLTFNEPFYQAGVRLSYAASDRLALELHVLNGYNRFVDNNGAKSLGLLATYVAREGIEVGFSNLLGRESADGAAVEQLRYYQSVSVDVDRGHWHWLMGLDFGLQTNSRLDDPSATAQLVAGQSTLRYRLGTLEGSRLRPYSITARAELFRDPAGFISGLVPVDGTAPSGLLLTGVTLGGEYVPSGGAYLRLEGRALRTADELALFATAASREDLRLELLLTLGISFEQAVARW